MRKYVILFLLSCIITNAEAQSILSLDSCRAMALRNNKQLNISRLNREVARYVKKSARTKYLPKVDAMGGYMYTSKEISLLSDRQKQSLNSLGTTLGTQANTTVTNLIGSLTQQGILTPDAAQQLGNVLSQTGGSLAQVGNALGHEVVKAFDTDTRNMWAGAIVVRQPIFMGGAIIAANKIADIGETMADDDLDMKRQATLYSIDKAYWTVVSLKQKQKLALSYRDLVKQLNEDVHKMIKQGVATKADGLKVDVKVNEADMQVTQVENGLSLSKMLLCQLCGIPMEDNITLADEERTDLGTIDATPTVGQDSTLNSRPEIRMLENSIEISKQTTNLVKAANLPHIALTGGYMTTNPNVYNGFQRNFSGVWNIGILVQIPVWNWFDTTYKIKASKAATNIAQMELSDTREKVQLQITQSRYQVKEAQKRLAMTRQNIKSADENLRCANLGFREGVMGITEVMEAQTAWQQAQSQKIDAEIEVKLTQVNLNKALGILE